MEFQYTSTIYSKMYKNKNFGFKTIIYVIKNFKWINKINEGLPKKLRCYDLIYFKYTPIISSDIEKN